MDTKETSQIAWNDFELGLRIACAALAVGGAVIVGPPLSKAAVAFVSDYVRLFHGEDASHTAQFAAVASVWGFICGVIFGASGWLRYALLPKIKAWTDSALSKGNEPRSSQFSNR